MYVCTCMLVCIYVCMYVCIHVRMCAYIYVYMCDTHTATRCNTLQHTATHCNTLQHTATHCNTLQHIAIQTLHSHTPREHADNYSAYHTHMNKFSDIHPYTYNHSIGIHLAITLTIIVYYINTNINAWTFFHMQTHRHTPRERAEHYSVLHLHTSRTR